MRLFDINKIVLGAVLVTAGCVSDEEPIDPGSGTTVSRIVEEVFEFDSLAQMALDSDLVIEGEVLDVRPGRETGQAHHRTQHAVAVVRITRVVHGQASAGDEIDVEFARYLLMPEHGVKRIVRADGADEYEPGEIGFYHLRELEGLGAYRTLNSQARLPIIDGVASSPLTEPDPLLAKLDGVSAEDVHAQMVEAAALVRSGLVIPAEPRVPIPDADRAFGRPAQ
jgi:hypothetical protein